MTIGNDVNLGLKMFDGKRPKLSESCFQNDKPEMINPLLNNCKGTINTLKWKIVLFHP